MAKDSDNLAGSLDTEHIGGLLTGFLAEEEPFDRRALWRIGSWGVGALGAVIIGLLANQSSIGWRREQLASTDFARQSQQIQSVAKESQNETRRLASAIDTLNGDRDRLYSRITVLEQGLESVTGAIARQKSTAASSPAAATPGAAATSATAPAPISAAAAVQAATQSPIPPPVIGPVATTSASTAEKPHMEAANAPPASPSTVASVVHEPATTPAATKPAPTPAATTSAATPASTTPAATPAASTSAATPATAAPLMESKSMMAPPDAAAAKLIEPEVPTVEAPKNADAAAPAPAPDVVASAPSASGAEPDATQSISQSAVQRTEFAVDVGGANSVGGLRALWRGLLKSRSNAPLAALRPIIVVKESRTGLGMQLRLVAGPIGDAAAAAKICATMIENQRSCETTVFDGQRLAMKAGEEPSASAAPASAAAPAAASTKPVPDKLAPAKPASARPYARHRGYGKRVVTEDPAKKPDPPSTLSSTLSSYFGNAKNEK